MKWHIVISVVLGCVLWEFIWFMFTNDFRIDELFIRSWFIAGGAIIYGWQDYREKREK